MFAPFRTFASTYSRVGVETGVTEASPHRLVAMLFDGAIESIHQARGALASRDIAAKGQAIGKAVRIVDEGLKGGLDRGAGGQLATDLSALYDYLLRRLTEANLRNDDAALAECSTLLDSVRQGWNGIATQAH
mgnify:FL=1